MSLWVAVGSLGVPMGSLWVSGGPYGAAPHLLKELVHEVVSVHVDDLVLIVAVLGLQGAPSASGGRGQH